MSHELKTPLNVIYGSSQLLQSQSKKNNLKEENIDKHTTTINQNCFRLIRLINNIIDVTKMESGFYNIKRENYNIVSIVEDITLSITDYTSQKGIDLVFDTEVEEKIIAIDPDKMERVILNLLSNAIKFTNPYGKISVSIYDKEENIEISVKDTGVGIPEDKLNVIFERFGQVDKTIKRNKEGSGIGLSLVKSLVEHHEGQISVKSEFGRGSEFIITLPVIVLDEEIKEEEIIRTGNVERIHIEFSDIYA
jgi:signal transduction histidine kinase